MDKATRTDFYQETLAPPAWRHVVVRRWAQRVAHGRIQRVIPDGHADVLIHASGAVEIVGLQDKVALPELPPGTNLQGVRLRPEAVAAAVKLPANELRNLTIPAEDILGSRQTRSLTDPTGLDNWVRSLVPDERTAYAASRLKTVTVSETADEMGITTRQLLRVFAANTGLSPKTYQRVTRLQRFIAETTRSDHLATAAINAGYADQAHLTREVRELTGLTPADLITERRRLSEVLGAEMETLLA